MKVAYKTQNGISYASVMQSVRINGKPRNQVVHYLGRVIDKEKGIYQNKERGLFVYDLANDSFSEVPEDFQAPQIERKSSQEKTMVDFGAAYFIDAFIKKSGLAEIIEAIPYKNKDSTFALVFFYVLSRLDDKHAFQWLTGNYTGILFPNAKLEGDNLYAALDAIGKESAYLAFFKAYLELLAKVGRPNQNIVIASIGRPDSIHMPMTAIRSANGKINRQVKVLFVIHADTHQPIYFRNLAGNAIDAIDIADLISNIKSLNAFGIRIDLLILADGFASPECLVYLYQNNIPFLTRCSPKTKFFKEIVEKHYDEIEVDENLTIRRGKFQSGRLIYLKKYKATYEGKPVFCYLGLDKEMQDVERQQLINEYEEVSSHSEIEQKRFEESLRTLGFFMLISQVDIPTRKLMATFFLKEEAVKVFELRQNFTALLPLVVRAEATLRGHFLVSFISRLIVRLLETRLADTNWTAQDVIVQLANLKARVFDGLVIPGKPSEEQEEIYQHFGMKVPKEIVLGKQSRFEKKALDKST